MKINLSSFLQWRFNIFICKILGWKITSFYICFLSKLYFFFNGSERCKIKTAVKSVFKHRKNDDEIESITANVFRGISLHYYEKFFNVYSTADALRCFAETHMENEGINTLNRALAKGRGVLLITGHFGGVELIPSFFAVNNYPATIIARFSTNHLRKISFKQASNFSTRIIDADRTSNIIKAISKNLKENRIVITQCDEFDEWKPSRHDITHFLGKRICLDRSINILSKRCGAAIVFGIMHRDSRHRFKFIVTSWEEMAKQYQRSMDMPVGEVLLKFMEHYIYKYPEEWYQWKKYPKLEMFLSPDIKVQQPSSASLLKPSFGNV